MQIGNFEPHHVAVNQPVRFIEVSEGGARLLARLPGSPMSQDQLAMLRCDNVAAAHQPGLAALGVAATPLAAVAPNWLARYRPGGRFAA